MRCPVALLAFVSACSSPPSPDAGAPDAAVARAAACRDDAEPPVSGRRTVTVNGLEREFLLHVPGGYARAPTAVVFNFHGWNSNAALQQARSKMDATADREGFAVIYPQGVGDSFNAGGSCCGDARAQDLDEAAFVRAMLDDVERVLCVDRRRVYSTGMSNGGFLSYRFACERADVFAAVAPVAAIVSVPACAPGRPISVLHFHGSADLLVPIDGRPSWTPPVPSLEQTIDGWVRHNGCTGSPVVTFQNGDVTCEAWKTCDGDAEVERCVVDGGGHTWPGGEPAPLLGATTDDVSASDRAWEFFSRHALP